MSWTHRACVRLLAIVGIGLGPFVGAAVAPAQEEYSTLAKTLEELSPQVRSRSKAYLVQKPFVRDPSVHLISTVLPKMATAHVMTSAVRPGVPLQKDHLLLQFKPDVTRDQIRALLRKHKLTVVSGVPEIGLLVVEIDASWTVQAAAAANNADLNARPIASPSVMALKTSLKELREESIIRAVAPNVLLSPTVVPRRTDGTGADHGGISFFWDWREGSATPAANSRDGNWGQKTMCFPAAWNFRTAIQSVGNTHINVGVLDVGFAPHADLDFTVSGVTTLRPDDHGNHVAGIVGAKFDDAGVNGVTPFAKLIVCRSADVTQATDIPNIFPVLSDVIATLVDFILNTPDVRVINLSLGYNWVPNYNANPNNNKVVQDLVAAHGVIVRSIANLARERHIILVSAAGNDTDAAAGFPDVEAQWGSPFNWAAMNKGTRQTPAMNIVVVESIGRDKCISPFSNVKGCVSAPGEDILSTAVQGFRVMDGTSMAAPHVTGLIALMYAYNPELTEDAVLKILGVDDPAGRPSAVSPAPMIDAFSALVACRADSLKHLADLNHDGKVDKSDFALFKTAMRQVEQPPGLDPKDLNEDGETSDNENIFPRADLNGSGKLSRKPEDKRLLRGKMLSDLEVMMEVWEDTTVDKSQLPTMLDDN